MMSPRYIFCCYSFIPRLSLCQQFGLTFALCPNTPSPQHQIVAGTNLFLCFSIFLWYHLLHTESLRWRGEYTEFSQYPSHAIGRLCTHRYPVSYSVRLETNFLDSCAVCDGVVCSNLMCINIFDMFELYFSLMC